MRRLLIVGVVLNLFFALNVYGANLDIRNGILYGATDVDVDGVLYDVAFLDGTLIELFGDVDENTVFPFVNPSDFPDNSLFLSAYEALDAQVFIDEFDTTPDLTNGIGTSGAAYIWTPKWTNGPNPTSSVGIVGWVNNDLDNNDYIFSTSTNQSFDTGWWTDAGMPGADHTVYAVWTLAEPVPVPGTLSLLSIGLLGLAGVSRKRANAV